MRNFIWSFILILFVGCQFKEKEKLVNLKCTDTITIYFSENSPEYAQQGIYKAIKYKYDYEYEDSTFRMFSGDEKTFICTLINEWGDTVYVDYADTSNYPRRED